jgi:hypothetical protein
MSKSNSSSSPLTIKLKEVSELEVSDSDTKDPEKLSENLKKITNLLETHLENSKTLNNILPSEYINYDPECIRKYTNFSFPKDYNLYYDFVDYYPSQNLINDKNITDNEKLKTYLKGVDTPEMHRDFISTLELVSPKTLTLINKIHELDAKDMAQYGKKFKHFIFSDSKTSMSGVKLLASALIATGMKLGYTAEPKLGVKKWGKMNLLSNAELEKSKYNNIYMLSSKSVYDEPISVPTKKEILARFNERPDNVHGENIRIILMDGGYKEGIDLFDIKYVHIFEPTLTQADQKQVIGRGTRTCGQKGLDFHPLKGWPLYVYVYDLKMEDGFEKSLGANSGIELYFKAKNLNIKLLNFINELETVCIQNAVDNELNQNIHSFSISFDEQGESLRGGDSSSSGSSSKRSSSSGSSSSRSSSGSSSSRSSSSSGSSSSRPSSSSRKSKSSSSRSPSKSSSRSSSRRSKSSSSRSSSEFSIEVVTKKSNTASMNKKFFSRSPEKNVEYSMEKPLNAIEMRQYVRDYFSQYAWDPVKMENNCVPAKGGKQSGGATIMTYTPTQAFVSSFFTPSNPLKGMLLWHSVGTGKTCTAIATATSTFEKQGYTILWVTRTTLKNDIWKNMFDQVCHEIIKLKIENQGIVIPSNNSDRMNLLSKSWRVRPMSYKQFSNLVSKKNQIYETMVKINGKVDPLRKTLLIIDEAHKLYGGGDLSSIETPDMVALHASLMNSYIMSGPNSVKLLLMTATPIQTDPMELIKMVNLFKMPDKQIPDSFDLFSEEYLDSNGFFTPSGLHKFRNETAGYISYLNREKDARQFSQPVISVIQTDVYSKQLLKQNKSATRKFHSVLKKEIEQKLKTLKNNATLKANENPKGYNTLKKICEHYEYPKSRNACKKIVASYKKEADKTFKEEKMLAKQALNDYKMVVADVNDMIKTDIDDAANNELNPLRYRKNRVSINDIESVYRRLKNCSKPMKNMDKIVEAAISNNPKVAQLKNEIDIHKQQIIDNSLILKKEKNKETREVLKELIDKDKRNEQKKSKKLRKKIDKFSKEVKKKVKILSSAIRGTQKMQKKTISKLKKLGEYDDEFHDKELELKIRDDITKSVEEIELKIKEREDNKRAKTMKKMEREQKKLEKEDAKKAKQHAKTMKIMEKEKAKEDKEFAKLQKIREAEFKKLDAEAKKQAKILEKQREKEAKEAEELAKKQAKEMEKVLQKQTKEAEVLAKKREKEANIEAKKREKEMEKKFKEAEALAKKEAKEAEAFAKKQAKQTAKTVKKIKGGKLSKTRRRR